MACQALQNYVLTDHARLEMRRRDITKANVAAVLTAPEQSEVVRPGRCVYQSKITFDDPPKVYLLCVFADIDREPPCLSYQ